jgi:hypothetical protein
MLEPHPDLTAPPDDAVLWRFMDFTKFVALLETSDLYFGNVTAMQDTHEGALTRPTLEGLRRMCEKVDPESKASAFTALTSLYRKTPALVCVSCWHRNWHESAAMWQLHLKSDEGVAVRTTYADMRRAFAATSDRVYTATVKYLDYASEEISLGNIFFPVVHKRKSFEHEAEVRLIWWNSDGADTLLPTADDGSTEAYRAMGRPIRIDLQSLVQQVYVSPTAQGWFAELVGAVTKRYGLTCPVIKSDLYADPIW